MSQPLQIMDAHFRADVYQLLAALFRAEPSAELLTLLQELDVDVECSKQRALLEGFCALKTVAKTTTTDELANEYFSVFIGLSEGEVSPYASWFIDNKLLSTPLIKLRQDLERMGFARNHACKEPEDHIAALCEIMAILIEEKSNKEIVTFFNKHILCWHQKFCQALVNHSSSVFYQKVGELANVFFANEQLYFEHQLLEVSISND